MYVFLLLLPLANAYYLPLDQAHPDLNMTVFPPLMNYHINGEFLKEEDYPWMARVVHSSKGISPHICTAICVGPRLFVTSVRCFSRVRIKYTHVLYQNKYSIPAKTFVLPTYHTKQRFDDIGIIVTKPFTLDQNNWRGIKIFNENNRTDPVYNWFRDLDLQKNRKDFYAIGYACDKKDAMHSRGPYDLTSINVLVDINICRQLTRWDETSRDYYVPCYHSCSIVEHKQDDPRCKSYHGVEGGAVVNIKTETLIGVATWGAYTTSHNLPVGFSIPNSQSFLRDYECAKKIRDDTREATGRIMYEGFCDDLMKDLDVELVHDN